MFLVPGSCSRFRFHVPGSGFEVLLFAVLCSIVSDSLYESEPSGTMNPEPRTQNRNPEHERGTRNVEPGTVRISDIPTPALVLDRAALDRNIARMAAFFASGSCRLRPHFKAHKTPEIAKRQLAAGSCSGLTCATVGEAEIAAGFCDDVLLANEIVAPEKCARVAALARRIA